MLSSRFLARCALTLLAATFVAAPAVLGAPGVAHAQEEEARLLFERGNEHLARGLRARGRRRTQELQQALDAYLAVVRLGARTRNVVFNLALTHQELGRDEEAFNYYSEYLRTFDLSEADRAEGRRRLDAMRPRLAVLSVTSTPEGAEVRIDRRDLPVRGTTPLELAVAPGAHRVFLTHEGYEGATAETTAVRGQVVAVSATLRGEAVAVQFIAPSGGTLTLDGAQIEAGRAVSVRPGPHVVRLELPGATPVERSFEVPAGSAPMALELSAVSATGPEAAGLSVRADVPSRVFLDGIPLGSGTRVDAPALPGNHMLRVESDGRSTLNHRVSLSVGQELALHVRLGTDTDGGVIAGRVITGILATVGVGIGAYFVGTSVELHDRWEAGIASQGSAGGSTAAELDDLANELEDALLGMDVSLALTAALGTLAIVFLAIDAGGSEGAVEVIGAPAPGGGTLQARLSW